MYDCYIVTHVRVSNTANPQDLDIGIHGYNSLYVDLQIHKIYCSLLDAKYICVQTTLSYYTRRISKNKNRSVLVSPYDMNILDTSVLQIKAPKWD